MAMAYGALGRTKKNASQFFMNCKALNLAPLTGIAIAINWLFDKLKQKIEFVKTTKLTTFLLRNMWHI
ncbi:hypothetical protein [Dickeya ananatis]|uniref:hypothetical protein n=1 Tax=Dickeya ananatis TaxID=3061286 RepID=UPI00388F1C7C